MWYRLTSPGPALQHVTPYIASTYVAYAPCAYSSKHQVGLQYGHTLPCCTCVIPSACAVWCCCIVASSHRAHGKHIPLYSSCSIASWWHWVQYPMCACVCVRVCIWLPTYQLGIVWYPAQGSSPLGKESLPAFRLWWCPLCCLSCVWVCECVNQPVSQSVLRRWLRWAWWWWCFPLCFPLCCCCLYAPHYTNILETVNPYRQQLQKFFELAVESDNRLQNWKSDNNLDDDEKHVCFLVLSLVCPPLYKVSAKRQPQIETIPKKRQVFFAGGFLFNLGPRTSARKSRGGVNTIGTENIKMSYLNCTDSPHFDALWH